MNIAYVTEWSPYEASGVLRKIVGQVAMWRALGHNVEVYALAPRQPVEPALGFGDYGRVYGTFSMAAVARFPAPGLGYLNKIFTARTVRHGVRRQKPDVIYYRQNGFWYPGIARTLRLAPAVMEINANATELELWGKSHVLFAGLTQKRVWKEIDGFVCVSGTIAEEYRGLGKPVETIPNSMWGSGDRRLPPTGNESSAFIFVSSLLTGGASWHGADKILPLAEAMPGSAFHIVGLTEADLGWPRIPANVAVHGPVYGEALVDIYRRCDIGIGALAMHRKNQEENSALKPLEYMMYGLPVILGYRETESRVNEAPFTLQIGNYDGNVADNIGRIAAFAEEWRGKRISGDLSFLSAETIERRRMDFVSRIASAVRG